MANIRLPNINYVVVSGHATGDGDVSYTPSGTAVLKFSIGHNENRKDKATDEWKSVSHFFNVVVFGQQAERVGEQLLKGSAVIVEGRLQQDRWETPEGQKRQAVKIMARRIQVLDKQDRQEASAPEAPPIQHDAEADRLDDIPF